MRQSTCFALATSAFDAECRTEIRMKEGLRALSNCLNSDESRVQVLEADRRAGMGSKGAEREPPLCEQRRAPREQRREGLGYDGLG